MGRARTKPQASEPQALLADVHLVLTRPVTDDALLLLLALGVLLVWMVAGEAPRPAAGGGIALPAAFKEHASDGVRALANRLLRAEAERRPAAPRVVDDAARLLRKQPPAPEGSTSIDSTRRDASNTSSMDDMSSTDVARALRIASA